MRIRKKYLIMKILIGVAIMLAYSLMVCGCGLKVADNMKEKPEGNREIEGIEELELETKHQEISNSNESEKLKNSETSDNEKKGIIIALDPGHQSWDVDMSAQEANAPGSDVMKAKATTGTSGQYSGLAEFQLNLDIALMVRDELVEQGYDVVMTREDNQTAISNSERATLANASGADISVRIHANGSEDPNTNGALVLIGSNENTYVGTLYDNSYRLAENVLNEYCNATGMTNLGIQENDTMTGINWSKIPVIILEMGFMSNEQDDLNMADKSYRKKMTEGIVNGINAYYGY